MSKNIKLKEYILTIQPITNVYHMHIEAKSKEEAINKFKKKYGAGNVVAWKRNNESGSDWAKNHIS